MNAIKLHRIKTEPGPPKYGQGWSILRVSELRRERERKKRRNITQGDRVGNWVSIIEEAISH